MYLMRQCYFPAGKHTGVKREIARCKLVGCEIGIHPSSVGQHTCNWNGSTKMELSSCSTDAGMPV